MVLCITVVTCGSGEDYLVDVGEEKAAFLQGTEAVLTLIRRKVEEMKHDREYQGAEGF